MLPMNVTQKKGVLTLTNSICVELSRNAQSQKTAILPGFPARALICGVARWVHPTSVISRFF
jgi:hypothetical protein